MFGTGDLDLSETHRVLADVGYEGMAAVERSRGAEAAAEGMEHLRGAVVK